MNDYFNYCQKWVHKGNFSLSACAKRFVFLLFGVFVLSMAAFAQQNTVSGTVTGNNNQPLPGVSVLVQNTSKGTATDNSGRFTIAASSGDVLLFRSIGYKDQTVTVGAQNTITVAMVNATDSTLNDVVVTWLPNGKKKRFNGCNLRCKHTEHQQDYCCFCRRNLAGCRAWRYG